MARVAYYPSRVHPFAGSLEPDEGRSVTVRASLKMAPMCLRPFDASFPRNWG